MKKPVKVQALFPLYTFLKFVVLFLFLFLFFAWAKQRSYLGTLHILLKRIQHASYQEQIYLHNLNPYQIKWIPQPYFTFYIYFI